MYLIYGKWAVARGVAQLCDLKNITYEIKDDSDGKIDFSLYEAIIPSPGVPWTHEIYRTGKIIAELDFAYQFLPKNTEIIAITGTDGKSTTTHIAYSILQKYYFGNKKIHISGNFEIPFSATIAEILKNPEESEHIIVVEISSFMSHFLGHSHLKPFAPDYTIWTNLKIDHLNWHRDLQEYFDAKRNLAKLSKKRAIINHQVSDFAREQSLVSFFTEFEDKISWFSHDKNLIFPFSTDGEKIFIKNFWEFFLSETTFSGLHNAMNWLSVAIVLAEMGIPLSEAKNFFKNITSLPHRLEVFAEKNGVIFVDDSKSTSAQSLEAALGAFGNEKNIFLIAGGSDKGDSFEHLEKFFKNRVAAVTCIGATKKHFSDLAKKSEIDFLETDDMNEATSWLYNQTKSGDILMLSPGCASFGLFKDYLDRANKFREAVEKL